MPSRPKLVIISLALVVAGMAAESFALQAKEPSAEAKQRYAQARKLLALGEKEKAIGELKAIIQLAPEFVEAQRDFLDNQRDKAESFIEPYEGYVKQNPNSAVAHYLLGKVYSNANKREKSDAEYNKALELNPEFGWAILAVSTVASRTGDNARSIEMLEKASKHAGDSVPLRLVIASNIINKKMYDFALREAERVLQLDPQEFNAYTTKWQARLSITLGADETREEVRREIQGLETKHGKDIRALLVAQSGYQMLEDEAGAEQAKKAILAIDPQHFERQPFNLSMGTSSGKVIRLSGPTARLLADTFSMKDEKQKIEAFKKLEKDVEDADAKLYGVYPAMLRSYVALKDLEGAERIVEAMVKANMDAQDLGSQRITLAKAFVEAKAKPDVALDHARRAIEQLRKPMPVKEGTSPESAEYQKEYAKKQLASALQVQGQILLEKGDAEQAADSLTESVQLNAQEDSLFELGRAYVKLGKKSEATGALAKAYAYEGKRQQEARADVQKVYDSKGEPLADFLKKAVDSHRAQVREAAIAKAVREIAKSESKQAPAFALMTLSGQKVQLADLRGKVLMLNFWATW